MAKQKIEIPTVEGCEAIFILTLNVDEKGVGKIAYNSVEGANLEKIGQALIEFGKHLEGCKNGNRA